MFGRDGNRAVAYLVASAVLFGGGLAVKEKREEAPASPSPTPTQAEPHRLAPTAHAATKSPFTGWQLRARHLCIESLVPGAPIATAAAGFRVHDIRVYIRFSKGQCKAAGFALGQTLVIRDATAKERPGMLKWGGPDQACAFTSPWLVSNYVYSVEVVVARTGAAQTQCGGGVEYTDLYGHELAHVFGLSHDQPYPDSIVRDGHRVSRTDAAYIGQLYSNNPL